MSLFATMAIVFGTLYAYMEFQLPDVSVLKDVHMQVPLRVYSADGKLIAEFGAKRRAPVTLNQVPKPLIEAVLATEDARFYSHSGVDPIGLLRATIAVLASGKKVEGASTITMQVARNFFLTRKKTYSRKVKEILLAIKIDREFSKEKILELYLNKVYFGNRAYGVAAAAHVYYGKSLDQLTLPEFAMIAGLPQAPSRNNPLKNPTRALDRRNHVLKRMLEVGYINQSTYDNAIRAPQTARYHEERVNLNAPYIAEMVRQAVTLMYGDRAYDSGLSVYTTITSSLQNTATSAVQAGLLAYSQRHGSSKILPGLQGALVAIDPKTGAILALQGGYDFDTSVFNRVTQAERQPGSSFKPFIYTAALAKGLTLASIVNDAPIMMKDSGENAWWRPENDTLDFYGPTRLRVGLTESRNLVSIRLLQEIGIPYTLDYVTHFGFDPKQLPDSLSLALGSGVETPMQMITGYAVFANGGYSIKPFFIEKIVNENHHVVYQAEMPALSQPVIQPQLVYLMTQAMRDVIKSGTAKAVNALGRHDLAGKTGTTNRQVDAWFSGFNSNLLATVWVGFDNSNTSLHEYGARAALPIWMQFMKTALANQPEATMPQPPDIIIARIDSKTGLLAAPGEKDGIFEVFEKDHMPTQTVAHAEVSAPESGTAVTTTSTTTSSSAEDAGQIF